MTILYLIPMNRHLTRLAPILVVTLAMLAGCATSERLSAAGDVHALLVAVRDDDQAAFDAHVDRRALEEQLRDRLEARAARANVGQGWKSLGLLLSEPVSRLAGDALIQPGVFRVVAAYYGYRPEVAIPGPLALATALHPMPDGRVCATAEPGNRCLLVFAHETGGWRLVAFDGASAMLALRGH